MDGEQHLQRPVERARPGREHDRGRDGDDAEVEIELRCVVDDEVRRLAEVVVPVADDDRVRAEQRAQRHPARGLGDDDEHRTADEHRVEPPVRPHRRPEARRAGTGRGGSAPSPQQPQRRSPATGSGTRARAPRRTAPGCASRAARAARRARARQAGRPGSRRSPSSPSPCRPSTARRPRAAPRAAPSHLPTTRRAMRYVGHGGERHRRGC